MPPEDNGGEELEGYMVEWWQATVSDGYGSAEVQTLKIGGDVDGEIQIVVGLELGLGIGSCYGRSALNFFGGIIFLITL